MRMAAKQARTSRVDANEARSLLDRVTEAMHTQFGDNTARLNQLDSHMATVAMVINHLFDEAERDHGTV